MAACDDAAPMNAMSPLWAAALTESQHAAPLLVGDLPEARQYDRHQFGPIDSDVALDPGQKLGHL